MMQDNDDIDIGISSLPPPKRESTPTPECTPVQSDTEVGTGDGERVKRKGATEKGECILSALLFSS